MMNDLDTLRPEVREALDGLSYFLTGTHNHDDFYTIRAELLRLVRDNDALRSKCNAIMSGSTRHLGRAEKAEAELAALKTRIAEAPVGVVNVDDRGCEFVSVDFAENTRVRLVVEK